MPDPDAWTFTARYHATREWENLPARIAEKIAPSPDGCWLWTAGRTRDGYGRSSVGGKERAAHRVTYELLVGVIPEGLEIDHLCRVRHCVNPDHLEPVAHRTNLLRGEGPPAIHALKTHCKQGHPLSGDNLSVQPGRPNRRICKACNRIRNRLYYRRKTKK